MGSVAKKRKLVVEVARNPFDGRVFSQVRKDPWQPASGDIVIDRQTGRLLDVDTIRIRAQGLARLLDAPYVEDLTWYCLALQKRECHCPVCCGAVDEKHRKPYMR